MKNSSNIVQLITELPNIRVTLRGLEINKEELCEVEKDEDGEPKTKYLWGDLGGRNDKNSR